MREKVQSMCGETQPGPSIAVGELPVTEGAHQDLPSAADSAPSAGERQSAADDPGNGGIAGESRVAPVGSCEFAARVLIACIRVYQWTLSPLLPICCRFEPSCSRYAVEALRIHGFWRGSCLAVWRILRCQPFCRGGRDPVPPPRRKPPAAS